MRTYLKANCTKDILHLPHYLPIEKGDTLAKCRVNIG